MHHIVQSPHSIIYFNNVTSIHVYYCFENDFAIAYAIYELMVLLVFPGTLLSLCYYRVIRELWASTQVITILTSSRSAAKQDNHRSYSVRWPSKQLHSTPIECEATNKPVARERGSIPSERSSSSNAPKRIVITRECSVQRVSICRRLFCCCCTAKGACGKQSKCHHRCQHYFHNRTAHFYSSCNNSTCKMLSYQQMKSCCRNVSNSSSCVASHHIGSTH